MLTLSSSELTRIAAAQRLLLSPLDHADLDEWRRQVCRALKDLLGAEKASYALPLADLDAVYFSEEVDADVLRSYPHQADLLERRWAPFQRGTGLGAYNREQLFQLDLDAFYRSEYYHEFVVPARVFDAIGLSSPLLVGEPGPTTVAHILLHHDRPEGRRFGERGLAIMRLLFPAFEAGVRTCIRLSRQSDALADALDAIAAGLIFFDRGGRVLYESHALSEMLANETESARVRDEMRSLSRAASSCLNGSPVPSGRLDRAIKTAAARYRIRGALVDSSLLGGGVSVLVSLERTSPEVPSDSALRERFGLTSSEARVARLISEGKTNHEIATLLIVSPHTSRHHTEHIMLKMGVKSRTEVAAKLLGR